MVNHAFILSLPRSGSTVLTSMLDSRKGLISPPESSFPQMLGLLTSKNDRDPKKLAALYHASTFPGTPLSLDESEQCMHGGDEEILTSIALSLAEKAGRKAEDIRLVIWKTTRTISLNRGPLATNGRFVILRRHPHNVFESQFRVHFGLHNRQPLRFALFRQSYEWAFSRIPQNRKFELDYENIPDRMTSLLEFLQVEDHGFWEDGTSSLAHVAATRPWLSEILKEFRNDDAEKRARLDSGKTAALERALLYARLASPVMSLLRDHYDGQSIQHIRERAKELLKS